MVSEAVRQLQATAPSLGVEVGRGLGVYSGLGFRVHGFRDLGFGCLPFNVLLP